MSAVERSGPKVRPVILCGGSGYRLWPMSRTSLPKQLLSLQPGQTMLQATAKRVMGSAFCSPVVIAGETHGSTVREQLAAVSANPDAIVLEPAGRNTAAAVGLAAYLEARRDPSQLLLVMPSDHVIGDEQAFHRSIELGVPAAEGGRIVTFGIKPNRAETGYGYIEASSDSSSCDGVRDVLGFVEKPSFQTAEQYLKSGSYYWNGGIFLFEAQTLIEELELFADDVASACRIAVATSSIDGDFLRPGKAAFLACRSIAIDRAVMEKTNRASVVPVDMSWSDLGSWEALWEISAKDEAKNAVFGDVITSGSSGSLIRSEGAATVAALGVQDLVIVATEDAVLVTRRERAQDVGSFVDTLRGAEHHHLLESPPQPVSGTDQAAGSGAGVQTRHITLVSGEKLVPERNCSVHWIVVSGTAQITYDQTNIVLRENESTFLPASTELQIENSGAVPLHLVEVQIGSSRERD